VAEIVRGQFLRLGLAGVAGTIGAGVLAGPAAAALPVATPQGDDVGFLAFGATAELTSLDWYRQALGVHGFSRGDRRRLELSRKAKHDHVDRLNAILGPDAVAPGDFASDFPRGAFASTDRALALGARLEGLLVGVYLTGAAFARDSATRLMLARLLTFDAQQLAWMRSVTGGLAAAGLPNPLALEQAGAQLDGLLTTPSFTSTEDRSL
jgi:hypothetical protein